MKTQILKPFLILLFASTFFNDFSQEKNTQNLPLDMEALIVMSFKIFSRNLL